MNNETETQPQTLNPDELDRVVGGDGLNGHSTGALRNVSGNFAIVGQKGALMSLGGENAEPDVTLKRGIIAI